VEGMRWFFAPTLPAVSQPKNGEIMRVQNKVIVITGGGNGMGRGMVLNLLGKGARVTVVFPGAIGTNIAANSGVGVSAEMAESETSSSFPTLAPAKAAELIIAGMENNSYRVLVGRDAKLMDLLCRFSPKRAASFIFKQMQALLPE
jgi:short-subunit dehydrogenase